MCSNTASLLNTVQGTARPIPHKRYIVDSRLQTLKSYKYTTTSAGTFWLPLPATRLHFKWKA